MDITIYHNPKCGSSRKALALIRGAGHEPRIVPYLTEPPTRAELKRLIARMGITARELLREKEAAFAERGLGDQSLGEDALIDAMIAEPILINRPIVVTPKGVKLCRPGEIVLSLLELR